MSSAKKNPLERFLAKPSRSTAIAAKCFDCQGGGADPGWQQAIRECTQGPENATTANQCPLWAWRPYQKRRAS